MQRSCGDSWKILQTYPDPSPFSASANKATISHLYFAILEALHHCLVKMSKTCCKTIGWQGTDLHVQPGCLSAWQFHTLCKMLQCNARAHSISITGGSWQSHERNISLNMIWSQIVIPFTSDQARLPPFAQPSHQNARSANELLYHRWYHNDSTSMSKLPLKWCRAGRFAPCQYANAPFFWLWPNAAGF